MKFPPGAHRDHRQGLSLSWIAVSLIIFGTASGYQSIFDQYSANYDDPSADQSQLQQESSDVYLQSVVNELQSLNGIVNNPSLTASSVQKLPSGEPQVLLDNVKSESELSYAFQAAPAPVRDSEVLSNDDLLSQAIVANPMFMRQQQPATTAAPPVPVVKKPPQILGFTTAELADMYKKALMYGAPVKHNKLVSAIGGEKPKILKTSGIVQPTVLEDYQMRLQRPVATTSASPQYAYYFYPLHTFGHELRNNYGYKILMPAYHPGLHAVESTKSETVTTSSPSPFMVAMTGVLATAMLFLAGIYFYPRILQLSAFVSRSKSTLQDDLLQLTSFITEAIEFYRNMRKQNFQNKRGKGKRYFRTPKR